MSLVTAPPISGSFTENMYVSMNGFGVPIPFFTDALTGADPFRASIPNPPFSFQFPKDWGSTPVMPYMPMPEILRPPTIPVCHKGCAVDVPVPLNPVPEPWHGALILVAVLVGLACRKTRCVL